MTGYTFVTQPTVLNVNWSDPIVWSGKVIPNAVDADVTFPIVTNAGTGASYISTIMIQGGESFLARSIDLHDALSINGTLKVSGAITGDQNGHISISGGTLTVGVISNIPTSNSTGYAVSLANGMLNATSITNTGILGNGVVTVGSFTDNIGINGYGNLVINADSFSESGTIGGGISINVKAGGFSGLANGILSGPSLSAYSGTIAINAGSLIAIDNSSIILNGGIITSRDPLTGKDVALTTSLQSIGSSGTLTIGQGSYAFGNLLVSGKVFLDSGSYSAISQSSIALTSSNLSIDTGGIVHGGGIIQGNIVNNGVILADPTAVTFNIVGNLPETNFLKISGTLIGTGHLEIDAPRSVPTGISGFPQTFSAGLELSGPVSQNVIFNGNSGTLKLDNPSSFTGSITPNAFHGTLGAGDAIILKGVSLAANPGVSYVGDRAGGTLTLQGLDGPITLHFLGNYTSADFQLTAGSTNTSSVAADLVINVATHLKPADLLWSQGSSFTIWKAASNGAITPTNSLLGNGQGVTPIAQADFNGDGNTDILVQNIQSQAISVLPYQNGNYTSPFGFGGPGGGGWSIVGVADVTGDGKADLIWRNGNATGIWQSTGTSFLTGNFYDTSVPADWHVVGTGDFNNDGKADLVWRNGNGALSIWSSTGFDFNRSFYGNAIGPDWHIEGTGDFDGDGKTDLLWRNDNGTTVIWTANASGFNTNFYVNTAVGNDWQIAKVSDINGDGTADILWQNRSGALAEWLSNGSGGFATSILPYSVTGWHLVASPADFV